MANIEAITIESGYIVIQNDSGPPRRFPTLTELTTRYRASLTGTSTGAIGNYVDVIQPVVTSSWALAYFGSVQLTATSGNVGSAAGGVFEVNMTSAFGGSTSGVVCGLFVGAYGNSSSDIPTCGLWIETIVASGLSFQADGSDTDMPILALVTSGAGTKSSLAIEFGSDIAGKTVTTGSSGMYHNQAIQVKVNGTLMYWPLSSSEGYFTYPYPILIGATGNILTQVFDGTKSFQIWTTCASTDTGVNYEPQYIYNIMTGAGQVGCRFRVNMETDVELGGWANAFKASVDLKTNGGATGLLSAGCFELVMPGSNTGSQGTYAALELEINCPGSWASGYPVAYIYCAVAGATKANFDSNGLLFYITGQTPGSGKFQYNNTLQVRLTDTIWYLPLSSVEGSYTTAYPIVLAEDVELRFGGGTVADGVIASWTGEELVFTSLHPCDAADSFRTVLIDVAIDMYASCTYAALSSMAWLGGTGATWATAVHGMLQQDATVRVAGYMMAGYFEIKNAADGCNTASAINLRWDNDSSVGFGGVMHSFIRLEDNSSATKVNNLFELYGMDMTTGAATDEIVCQVGAANTPSHCIKISANGVPYWILASSTPPA